MASPLTSAHHTSPHFTTPHFTSPQLTSAHLTSPQHTSPHHTTPHKTSQHLTSLHLTTLHNTSLHVPSAHLTTLCRRPFRPVFRGIFFTCSLLHFSSFSLLSSPLVSSVLPTLALKIFSGTLCTSLFFLFSLLFFSSLFSPLDLSKSSQTGPRPPEKRVQKSTF